MELSIWSTYYRSISEDVTYSPEEAICAFEKAGIKYTELSD